MSEPDDAKLPPDEEATEGPAPEGPAPEGPAPEGPAPEGPAPEGPPAVSRAKRPRYWAGAHTTHRLRFHLVFVPKYRKRVLEGPVAVRLRELIGQACEVNGWETLELAIQPDHVHLLVQVPPRDGVPQVVKILKGGTSRVLRAEFPDLVEFLWGTSFWAVGYFAVTVGTVEGAVVARYIREQREL